MKNILSYYLVTNRSNMFVYKDDKKNIYYLKMVECIQGAGYTVVSRQSSLLAPPPAEDVAWSRSSSVTNNRGGKKDSLEEAGSGGGVYSRSNSVGECDKRSEDYILLKVFGITAASQNIKQDLVAVLQKKLDDKVVEVISTMIQRNSRCKLSSDDVFFLQKPATEPDKVLQFTVPLSTIHYLQAISYYLRQNLLQIPLIAPNYMAGCRRFRDLDLDMAQPEGGHIQSDVFLYNECNPRGDHKVWMEQ